MDNKLIIVISLSFLSIMLSISLLILFSNINNTNGSTATTGDLYVGHNFVLYEEPAGISFGQLVKEGYGNIYTIGYGEYGMVVKSVMFYDVHWKLYICESCPVIVVGDKDELE